MKLRHIFDVYDEDQSGALEPNEQRALAQVTREVARAVARGMARAVTRAVTRAVARGMARAVAREVARQGGAWDEVTPPVPV